MSVDHLGGRLNYWLGVKAPRREFQHRYYLFSRHVKPVHHLADSRARLQVLKHH